MTTWPDTRDSLLIRLDRSEDRAAWDDFVTLYQPLIYRYARRRGLQDADARDVTQAVLYRVAKSAGGWKAGSEHGRFRGWLVTVTRHLTIDLLRRSRELGSGRTTVWQLLDQIPDRSVASANDSSTLVSTDSDERVDPNAAATWRDEYEYQLLRHAAKIVRSDFSPDIWTAFWETTIGNRSIADVANSIGKSAGAVYAARSRVMKRIADCARRIRELESDTDQLNLKGSVVTGEINLSSQAAEEVSRQTPLRSETFGGLLPKSDVVESGLLDRGNQQGQADSEQHYVMVAFKAAAEGGSQPIAARVGEVETMFLPDKRLLPPTRVMIPVRLRHDRSNRFEHFVPEGRYTLDVQPVYFRGERSLIPQVLKLPMSDFTVVINERPDPFVLGTINVLGPREQPTNPSLPTPFRLTPPPVTSPRPSTAPRRSIAPATGIEMQSRIAAPRSREEATRLFERQQAERREQLQTLSQRLDRVRQLLERREERREEIIQKLMEPTSAASNSRQTEGSASADNKQSELSTRYAMVFSMAQSSSYQIPKVDPPTFIDIGDILPDQVMVILRRGGRPMAQAVLKRGDSINIGDRYKLRLLELNNEPFANDTARFEVIDREKALTPRADSQR